MKLVNSNIGCHCPLLFNILPQDSKAQASEQDGPEPPGHVKKRLTKKLHFLERVADSKRQALAANAGIRKKSHKSKDKQQKPLPDLHSLAELLAEVGQKQQQQAPNKGQLGAEQPNKQKGRTEQINGTKARRTVTYGTCPLSCSCKSCMHLLAAANCLGIHHLLKIFTPVSVVHMLWHRLPQLSVLTE